jgi:ornithine cyclodeaminase/alanine dehydrogenase-like protein (mu-crystallin family)
VENRVTRVVDASAVNAIVTTTGLDRLYDLAIDRLNAMLVEYTRGTVDLKERDGFVLSAPHDGLLEWMPAIRRGSTVSVKMVGYNPHNPLTYRLPTILSTLYVFDAATGHLRSVIDGTFATALRTGAASAIASRILARPGARTVGLIGCGAQAVTQLHALSRVFDVNEVLVSDLDATSEKTFARRSRFPADRVRVASPAEVERHADIICTATSVAPGAGPVLSGDNLRPGVHINSVGSDMPGKCELPRSLLRQAVVCPDHPAQAAREGECQQLDPEEIGPSLFDLVQSPALADPLREVLTVYDSTGLALQDLAMAELFEDLAVAYEVGHELVIETNAGDPQDPYAFLADAQPDRVDEPRNAYA